ncbi:MAG TPA: ABC transporter ATP-binding protein [Thermodesulfobacteriota bacterium]|nr:ABC transporter ATP-binding protein [Thermodesulfobacteriota bacterium]
MPGCDDRPMIDVESLSLRFGPIEAVSDVSFRVRKGEIFGLVGSDGAGKSSLLRVAATLIKPSSGRILIDGLDVVIQKRAVKSKIGYMPQRFGLYQDLTVEENFDFFMDIFGLTGHERTERKERYLGFSNLLPFLNRVVGNLSGGMKQKLGLACVLVHEPEVLILDEPTNGVDPVSRQDFWGMLTQMREAGKTILISTAYLDEGEKCDRLALMHRAKFLAIATPEEMQAQFPSLEQAMIHKIQDVDRGLLDEKFKS